jgi:nicotinamide-nucleotide amidase
MERRKRAAVREESARMDDLKELANALMKRAKQADLGVITAESCTAGLMCQVLADAEGASQFFHGGFVTYTKLHKSCALGVPETLLREKGAVCGEVARAMAEGALRHSKAGISAAITGVAGPEPDDDGNPVGRVCIAIARRGSPARDFERRYPDTGRDAIRRQAVADALKAMTEALASVPAAA